MKNCYFVITEKYGNEKLYTFVSSIPEGRNIKNQYGNEKYINFLPFATKKAAETYAEKQNEIYKNKGVSVFNY